MPEEIRSQLYIFTVAVFAFAALYVDPSVVHTFGWITAFVSTYFYVLAEEHVAEMRYELTHFDPTPGPHA